MCPLAFPVSRFSPFHRHHPPTQRPCSVFWRLLFFFLTPALSPVKALIRSSLFVSPSSCYIILLDSQPRSVCVPPPRPPQLFSCSSSAPLFGFVSPPFLVVWSWLGFSCVTPLYSFRFAYLFYPILQCTEVFSSLPFFHTLVLPPPDFFFSDLILFPRLVLSPLYFRPSCPPVL